MPGREGPHHTYGGAQKNDQDYVDIVYIIGNKAAAIIRTDIHCLSFTMPLPISQTTWQ